jgi:hypothetical protein
MGALVFHNASMAASPSTPHYSFFHRLLGKLEFSISSMLAITFPYTLNLSA